MANKDIEVKWVHVDTLKPNPKNMNHHSDAQVERLAKILAYQGFRTPIVVSNLSGFMMKGHCTLKAAKLNGWEKVPVSFQDFDDLDAEYAYMVSDNGIASWSNLDLAEINAELANLGPFDTDLLGLKSFTLDPRFDEPDEKGEPKDKDAELNTCPNCGVLI